MNKIYNYWFKLDNAAKIYPAILSKTESNIFRVSAELNDNIKPDILNQAVVDLKKRFPSMYVKLRRGLFWYYLEKNEKMPIVKKESPYINEMIDISKNNNYRFTIFYYNNRISLEWFHSLCDGYGAIEFLKAITYRYLELLGKKMKDENKVLTIKQEETKEEMEDSFDKNYTGKVKRLDKIKKAYHIRDIHFPHYYDTGIIIGKINVEDMLSLARKNNSTITEYLSALLTFSIYEAYKEDKAIKKRPINLSIPVNMRKFFNSKTLRNFSLFFYTSVDFSKGNISFNDILKIVKEDFNREIDKDKLQSTLNSNVGAEKSIIMRIVPVFIKNIALKIAFNLLGDSLTTMTLSNIGNIDLPLSMKRYVKDFGFNLSSHYTHPNGLAIVSCNGTMSLSFSRKICDTNIEKIFFRHLANEGIKVKIESNMLEYYV